MLWTNFYLWSHRCDLSESLNFSVQKPNFPSSWAQEISQPNFHWHFQVIFTRPCSRITLRVCILHSGWDAVDRKICFPNKLQSSSGLPWVRPHIVYAYKIEQKCVCIEYHYLLRFLPQNIVVFVLFQKLVVNKVTVEKWQSTCCWLLFFGWSSLFSCKGFY